MVKKKEKFEVEKALLLEHIQATGLRRTSQRDLILEIFLSTEDHLTSEDLHNLVHKKDPSVGLTTVYRTLKLLTEAGLAREAEVRYYTMGAEVWRSAPSWPPPGATPRAFYLGSERTLTVAAPTASPEPDRLQHDPESGSGRRSRWRTLVSPFVVADYPDRNVRDRWLLVYRTPPLDQPIEIAGHPIVKLFVSAEAPDGALFAYLEDETADGGVHYVTEGQLRLVHHALDAGPPMYTSPAPYRSFLRRDAGGLPANTLTRVTFDLLPTAYRFARGSRIRLALATGDADHFAPIPDAAQSYGIGRSRDHASLLELPVCAGS